jgi:PAS domain S-box-containing protein
MCSVRAGERLRPEDLGFGRLFERIRDAVIVADAKTQRIVLWNAAAAKMFGYSASEALELRVEELVPEPLKDAHRAGITRYARTGHGRYIDSDAPLDLPAVRKNGQEIRVELSLSPVRPVHDADDGESQFVLAIIRDVTERKRAEEAVRQLNKDLENRVEERTSQLEATIAELESNQQELRHSEEIFRLLVEGVREYAIFMLGPDGRIVSWNEGAERVQGYEVSEAVGEHFSVFYTEEDVDRGLPGEELRVAAIEGRFEEEGWRVRKDGTLFQADVVITALRDEVGNLRGFSQVTRDITARKEAEEALRSSLRKMADLKAALDESAVVAITDENGKITYVNDKFCEISKYYMEELVGQDHRVLNSGYHTREFFENLWNTITRGDVWRGEIKNQAQDGSTYWVETTIVPFMDESGKPDQYFAICNDITRYKETD